MLKVVDVRFAWDEALPMVQAVKEKCKADWRCEDVYASCLSGQSVMYMPQETNSGVLVASIEINKHTLKRYLFIWVCFSKEHDAQERYSSFLEDLARENDCEYIEMESPRAGFVRSREWEALSTRYRKGV